MFNTHTLGSYRKNKRLTHLCVRTFTYPTKVSSEQFVCSESGSLEVPELNPGLAPALKVQNLIFFVLTLESLVKNSKKVKIKNIENKKCTVPKIIEITAKKRAYHGCCGCSAQCPTFVSLVYIVQYIYVLYVL